MKQPPSSTPVLHVVDSRGADGDAPAQTARTGGTCNTLDLGDGTLTLDSGEVLQLIDRDEFAAIGERAQAVAESALADLTRLGTTVEPALRAALLVAAVSKLDVYRDVRRGLTSHALLRRAFDVRRPRAIEWWAGDAGLARAVLHDVGHRAALSVHRGPVLAGSLGDAALRWAKSSRWDWTVRAVASIARATRSRGGRAPSPGAILGAFDVRNAGMVGSVGLVLKALEARGIASAGVVMDHRVGKLVGDVADLATVPLTAFVRAGAFGRALAGAPRVLRALREGIARSLGDPTERAIAQVALRRLHVGYVAQTLVDLAAVERLFDVLQPRALVVASDAHRYARMLVLAAGARGVPSVVRLHGALVGEHVYVPVVASRMLAWGPWCRDWFVRRGVAGEAVASVGFVRAPRRRPFEGRALGRPTVALFAAQPIPDAVTRSFLGWCLEAVLENPSLRLRVRPHPGEGRRAFLAEVLATWPASARDRTEVSPVGRALGRDLEDAHVVLASQSTVGIDALTAGVPLVLLRHPMIREAIPFLEFGSAEEASSSAELIVALKGAALPDRAAERAAAVGTFLDAYVGREGPESLDAAARAIQELAQAGRPNGSVRTP